MGLELTGQNQLLIQPGAVFLKVSMAHTAIFSKGFGFQGDGEVRDTLRKPLSRSVINTWVRAPVIRCTFSCRHALKGERLPQMCSVTSDKRK